METINKTVPTLTRATSIGELDDGAFCLHLRIDQLQSRNTSGVRRLYYFNTLNRSFNQYTNTFIKIKFIITCNDKEITFSNTH